MGKKLLIIFYRNPELGKVKTRLAKSIGDERAMDIYMRMAAHTRFVASCIEADRVVYYSDIIEEEDNWLNEIFSKQVQVGTDLGERMGNAFQRAFSKGYNSICIIGTDCPGLTAEFLDSAFKQLEVHDVVIGPATDGGYYLLGMNNFYQEFFKEKPWSTDLVFMQTMNDIKNLNLSVYILPTLTDVDEEKDLPNEYL